MDELSTTSYRWRIVRPRSTSRQPADTKVSTVQIFRDWIRSWDHFKMHAWQFRKFINYPDQAVAFPGLEKSEFIGTRYICEMIEIANQSGSQTRYGRNVCIQDHQTGKAIQHIVRSTGKSWCRMMTTCEGRPRIHISRDHIWAVVFASRFQAQRDISQSCFLE